MLYTSCPMNAASWLLFTGNLEMLCTAPTSGRTETAAPRRCVILSRRRGHVAAALDANKHVLLAVLDELIAMDTAAVARDMSGQITVKVPLSKVWNPQRLRGVFRAAYSLSITSPSGNVHVCVSLCVQSFVCLLLR